MVLGPTRYFSRLSPSCESSATSLALGIGSASAAGAGAGAAAASCLERPASAAFCMSGIDAREVRGSFLVGKALVPGATVGGAGNAAPVPATTGARPWPDDPNGRRTDPLGVLAVSAAAMTRARLPRLGPTPVPCLCSFSFPAGARLRFRFWSHCREFPCFGACLSARTQCCAFRL